MSDLLRTWCDLVPASARISAVSRTGSDLLSRWNEPHRQYHTVEHLRSVLWIIDEHASYARDVDIVRLAAWYHDAIYDPRRVDNEESSALLAEATLPGLDIGSSDIAEVARLVRLTASHDPATDDRNGALLTDADLAILAATPETYRTYTIAVRREYAHLSEGTFTTGRATVLQHLLSMPYLFRTPVLRDRWEEAARQNITDELTSLRNRPTPFASI